MKQVGSRAEVMHGTAMMTSGGLKKKDLKYVDGRIVSKAQSKAGKDNDALKKWRKAVAKAKKNLGIEKGDFALIKNKLLREAKKIYKTM